MLGLTELCIICIFALSIYFLVKNVQWQRKKYPPGPWGFPVIGHIPLLGRDHAKAFQNWQKQYGDIFTIRLGSRRTVVVNGYTLIKEGLERKDDAFSNRPTVCTNETIKKAYNGNQSFGTGPFNPTYVQLRNIMTRSLHRFTHTNFTDTQELIQEQAALMVEEFLSWKGEPHCVDEEVSVAVGSIMYQLLFGRGKNVREEEMFRRAMRSTDALITFAANGNPCDVIPWLKFFMRKRIARFEKLYRDTVECLKQQVKHHSETIDKDHIRDITDLFLLAELPDKAEDETQTLTKNGLYYPGLNGLLTAGLETTKTTLIWLLIYMALYPEVQNRIHAEIDEMVGSRKVNLNDRPKLSYTEATIFEVMRIVGIVPFLAPHSALNDTKLQGYDIDKDTFVIFNVHSIDTDETQWENPDKFSPERLLNSSNKLDKEKCGRILSFSLGRRQCVGEYFAKMELLLVFASVLQKCSITKVDDQPIDMTPRPGITRRPKPAKLIIKERY